MTKIDHLAEWLNRGQSETFTVTVDMTPDLAARIVECNDHNRPLRWAGPARTVASYKAAMERGEWVLNGAPVVMSKDGLLNDGQHRLQAVIKAGIAVPMDIKFGVARETRHTIDQGAGRTPSDILAMNGFKNTNKAAHALRFLWCYENGYPFSIFPSPDQLLAVADVWGERVVAALAATRFTADMRLSAGGIAAAFAICADDNPELASKLADGVATGLNIADVNSPVFRLRKRYLEHLGRKDARINAVEQAALFIKTFNFLKDGQSVKVLVWRFGQSEAFPRVAA